MALNKKNRLKKKKDFEGVFKKGKASRGNFLFAKYSGNKLGFPRLAFIVSSKVSRKAVTRNRIRRVLSGLVGAKLKTMGSVDIALIADKKIVEASKEEVGLDLNRVLDKIK